MNRLLWVCALFALFAAGCGGTSTNTNKPASTPTPAGSSITTTSSPGGESKDGDGEEEEEEKTDDEGDVTGAYFPAGQLPAEFADIEHLSLATVDAQGESAPLNGFIRPKARSVKDFKLVDPKLEGKFLTFTTNTVGGVGYSFKGAFERLDDFSKNPPAADEVILKGTLTKMEDGEEAALTRVGFVYSAGG